MKYGTTWDINRHTQNVVLLSLRVLYSYFNNKNNDNNTQSAVVVLFN